LTPKGIGGGLLDRLIAAFRGHGIARRAIVESSPDLIVTLAVPTFGWQAVRVARKLGIPIVYRALDVSHLIRGGVWKPFVWLAERYVARNATLISANNPAMEEFVTALGQRRSGVEVHYPPMAIAKFQKGDRSKGRHLIGIDNSDFVVMYMGSFFEFSGLPEVIAEYSRIRPLDSKLLLVGGGKQDSRLRELVKNLNLETEVLFTGFVSFEDLPDYLSAADALINPMKKSLVSDTALPNKVIQYLLAARPVVSTDLKGLTSTLRDFDNLQWTSSPEECIRKALANKSLALETDSSDYSHRLGEIFGENAIARFEHFLETAVAK
jgi:glycosyltransferase involved in cell wall biosynthesis